MARILALDCATTACSVALQTPAGCEQLMIIKPKAHNRVLLPMVNRLMTQADLSLADLDLIVCGVGPGAFMGVRIAVAAAQGFAYATNVPLMSISSLYALAQQGWHIARKERYMGGIFPAIDARLGQLYWAYYVEKDGQLQQKVPPRLSSPPDIRLQDRLGLGLGDGWAYQDKMSTPLAEFKQLHPTAVPQARHLIELAQQRPHPLIQDPERLTPLYLRDHTGKAL